MSIPRVLIAGVRGGSGKTLVSLGLIAAWRKQGRRVGPFKKGPDYIDAAWLAMAADRPCRTLDLFLMPAAAAVSSFVAATADVDVAVIEGNRGLFDGMDAEGTYSTAELAKLLDVPVILTVDCTKSTRTVAAVVLGCQRMDLQVPIGGVILNRTAGPRHESVVRNTVERICGLPVVGAVARMREQLFPERHLGLVPPPEHDQQTGAIGRVAGVAEKYLDLDAIWALAQRASNHELRNEAGSFAQPATARIGPAAASGRPKQAASGQTSHPVSRQAPPRIGVFRDEAFQFYYPANLEALVGEGASLIEISPLRCPRLPDVDALYIGGGFPETMASGLAANKPFLDSLRRAIEQGLPVYAECGGAVYLGEKLTFQQNQYPMAGVLPVSFSFHKRPQGHGYSQLETVRDNPFFSVGDCLRGHEFHYTCMQSTSAAELAFAFRVRRGYGFDGQRDGLCCHRVLACYTHVHALGTERWAPSMVRAADRFSAAHLNRRM